ncbi:hypothetical protein VZQ01_06485 [Myxococcus faecalis]|uniref:hypothetical protein n=1 Tax=Myxococcus faecalis TaxID=3115646 RepID=UPI003CEDC039
MSNLVDGAGVGSGLSLQLTDGFWQGWTGACSGGGTTASTGYPASATRDTFFIGTNEGTTDTQAQVRLSLGWPSKAPGFPQRSDANARQVAAIVPFSGGRVHSVNGVSRICRLATEDVPVWTFHAADDGTVHVSDTAAAVNGLNACSPPSAPVVTRYENVGHEAYSRAYYTDHTYHSPNLYEWLLAQQRP